MLCQAEYVEVNHINSYQAYYDPNGKKYNVKLYIHNLFIHNLLLIKFKS
jgi:hypothetical protein